MSRETQITCVTSVFIDFTFAITSTISTFAIYDCAGILQAFLVNQSFVRIFTPPEKSQYVVSTFAATLQVQTRKKQRFFKGVFSDLVNSIEYLRHCILNRDVGHSVFYTFQKGSREGREGQREMIDGVVGVVFCYAALSRDSPSCRSQFKYKMSDKRKQLLQFDS